MFAWFQFSTQQPYGNTLNGTFDGKPVRRKFENLSLGNLQKVLKQNFSSVHFLVIRVCWSLELDPLDPLDP